MSSMDDNDFESDSEFESRQSSGISVVADVNAGNLLLHAASMVDLLHIEQQLQSTLKTISALREDGLLSCIEAKSSEFANAQQSPHAAENVVVWARSVLSRVADKPYDVRLHVTLNLIKRMSGCGLGQAILKEVCSSYECARLCAAASFMCELWAIMQNVDATARLRKLCAQEPVCLDFTLHMLHVMRSICSVLPDSYPQRNGTLVVEHTLSSVIGSLDGPSVAAPHICPLRMGFVADTHRACAQVCQLIHAYAQRIVLRTPSQVTSGHVQKIMGLCGARLQDPSAILAITAHLQQPDLWQSMVRPIFSGPDSIN
jgi:hypothetical protein